MKLKTIIAWAKYIGYTVVQANGLLMIGSDATVMYLRVVLWYPKIILRMVFYASQDFFKTMTWKEAFGDLKNFNNKNK